MTFDYLAACKEAADRQGITAIAEILTAAEFVVQVEQTGGFTMVATVAFPNGTVAITDDADRYVVGAYPDETWTEGELAPDYRFVEKTPQALVDEVAEAARRLEDPATCGICGVSGTEAEIEMHLANDHEEDE